jgi:hypothetical protein
VTLPVGAPARTIIGCRGSLRARIEEASISPDSAHRDMQGVN